MTEQTLTAKTVAIHPTAIVDPTAQLDSGVTVEPYAIIEGDVTIGSGTVIGSHTRIAGGTRLGHGVIIHHGAAVGTAPQDLKYAGERTELFIGDRTIVREFADLNRGTAVTGRTMIGSDCMIMAYAHVAHDNRVGNHVILANAVQLGGHVTLGDWVFIGGATVVHQFSLIGAHAMIGGGFRVTQDVLPYVIVGGYPLKTIGLNRIGLERRGFSTDQIRTLSKIIRIVVRSKLNKSQAVERLRAEMANVPEALEVAAFIEQSARGIVR
ncbi:MAG TPA: acyl-ACP--UDP-N-acetylglucosamine O-acyltransferase [Acidobacteriota bacterium]|nr:acyl-ACP--UDP-N-acetylglucosamine O-acyltransferase [Acidobacteriota bacterium]